LAEKRARAIARGVAQEPLDPSVRPSTLTLRQLLAAYTRERRTLLSERRMVEVERVVRLLTTHLGEGFLVADLGKNQVETYEAARRSGELVASWGRNGGGAVGAASVRREIEILHAALNWATMHKANGRPLIPSNPIRGVSVKAEPKPARPVASRERSDALVAKADSIDSTGGFRVMLNLAWFTGRRLGAIVGLRVADVLLNKAQVAHAIANAGGDERLAAHWPAAIRWAAETDKEDVEWIVPIPDVLSDAIAHYIRQRGIVGQALLFPVRTDATTALSKETAHHWLRQAEKGAGLLHQRQGGWHAFRRARATARKHMPLQDVMAAGGWTDPAALQRAYQHADGQTLPRVMEAD